MNIEPDGAAAHGLRHYLNAVAHMLRLSPDTATHTLDEPAGAYLALDGRLSEFPTRDVALLWDEENGWSIAVETLADPELVVVAYHGGDVLADPAAVAGFVRAMFADRHPGTPEPPRLRAAADRDGLADRLAAYTAPEAPLPG